MERSKILYKTFNIETQTYSINKFIAKFNETINNNQKYVPKHLNEIRTDYE